MISSPPPSRIVVVDAMGDRHVFDDAASFAAWKVGAPAARAGLITVSRLGLIEVGS